MKRKERERKKKKKKEYGKFSGNVSDRLAGLSIHSLDREHISFSLRYVFDRHLTRSHGYRLSVPVPPRLHYPV